MSEPEYTKYFQDFTDDQKKKAIKFFNLLLFGRLDYYVISWFDRNPTITYDQVQNLMDSPCSTFLEVKLNAYSEGKKVFFK